MLGSKKKQSMHEIRIYEYWSSDRKFGMSIQGTHLNKILESCKESKAQETGGIIVGYYTKNLDCGIVTDVSLSPSDSKRGLIWFYRGISGLQRWLNRIWENNRYYLGEWHFHPFASASISQTDKFQMVKIATNKGYHCPEPILLIIGGNPTKTWEVRVYLCIKGNHFIELYQQI